ncbi:MAG: hypothetical protein JNL70_07200 [Saprospiraceae bacterium]|nr:hypothetical protein [Saprospiraceae bacterium]
MNALIQTTKQTLSEFCHVLTLLNDEQFSRSLSIFSGSSVGMHARHVIEFYQCLFNQIASQTVNYDRRCRDILLQTQPDHFKTAVENIIQILDGFENQSLNTPLSILSDSDSDDTINSSLSRELQYNLEHTIHHSALIKIGVLTLMPNAVLPPTFGIAPSTFRHQQKQATCVH